jgi:membrane-bound serine protease (ClpP class)
MKIGLALAIILSAVGGPEKTSTEVPTAAKKVYVVPIREDIMPPLVYVVRRGVKEAMESKADLLVLDIDSNGGRVDVMEEIIDILNKFKGQTVAFVDRKAFSAGALICFAAQRIYMAPQSVIGAAAVVTMAPGGGGTQSLPDTVEIKQSSAISALVRANAEKNGHNVEVADAMVKKTKELKIDGKTLNEKGQILTLTNKEAEQEYGNPPKRLLSSGTMESLDELLKKLGYADAERHEIKTTGAEKVAFWLNAISPLLLLIGVIGIYLEFKMPGVTLPGIVGVAAFALYFFGGYVAGLSGMEWVLVFILGLALVVVEIFIYPGTIAIGLLGAALMLVALIMAMVDIYPGMPSVPSLPQLQLPIQQILIAMAGGVVAILVLSRFLPKTSVYRKLVSQTASGMKTELVVEKQKISRQGHIGVTISPLRPGGKAKFGDEILDVISQGDMVPPGTRVRIIGSSGAEPLVEVVQ